MSPSQDCFAVEPFERFMLAGESDGFPMSFEFELELAGRVDSDRLLRAVEHCVPKHPILFSTVDAKQKRWKFNPKCAAEILADANLSPLSLRTFDLQHESGIRIVNHSEGPGGSRLSFMVHHACVDGMGALDFIRDVGDAYGALEGGVGESVEADQVNQAIDYLKKFRTSYGGNRWWHALRWPLDLVGMLWSFEMVFNRPKALVPREITSAQSSSGPVGAPSEDSSMDWGNRLAVGNDNRELTREQTQVLIRNSKLAGQTLNDRVMEVFFHSIEAWNHEFNPEHAGDLVRLMIPMNLRKKRTLSAANMVAMVNFDRKVGKWKSMERFRKWLRLEMKWVKRLRAGVIANRYLQLQEMMFGYWPMQRNHQRCYATCLVSNLGSLSAASGNMDKAWSFGGLRVSKFHAVVPLRPHTNVFACVFSFDGRLTFNVTYNRRLLTQEHVSFLLDDIVDRLVKE